MAQRTEPYFDPHSMPHDDADGYDRPHPASRQQWSDPPPNDRTATARRPRRGPAKSGLRRAAVPVAIVVVILVIAAGGALLASGMGWIHLGGLPFGGGASSGGAGQTGANAQVVFSGDAKQLVAAPGNIVQEDTSVSPPVVWLRSHVKAASATGPTGGVSVKVPSQLVPRIEGRAIRVTVSARTGGKDTPSPFAVAYSAGDKGTSGWIVFTPTKTLDDYSFVYVVPIGEINATSNPHYIGIWSDISGGNAPLSVQRITIEPR